MNIKHHPSPNFGDRKGHSIDMLVIHYTAMESAKAALNHLCDPKTEVSAHYLIDEDGTVYQLVDEKKRAWHAGNSGWRGHSDINSRSIGIELYNPGHERGYKKFPKAQIDALKTLCRGIQNRHAIPDRNVVGHADIAPHRKKDPGEKFPWQQLAQNGTGLYPARKTLRKDFNAAARVTDRRRLRHLLMQYGYPFTKTGSFTGATLEQNIIAFQRHFEPEVFFNKKQKAGIATKRTVQRLKQVNKLARRP